MTYLVSICVYDIRFLLLCMKLFYVFNVLIYSFMFNKSLHYVYIFISKAVCRLVNLTVRSFLPHCHLMYGGWIFSTLHNLMGSIIFLKPQRLELAKIIMTRRVGQSNPCNHTGRPDSYHHFGLVLVVHLPITKLSST